VENRKKKSWNTEEISSRFAALLQITALTLKGIKGNRPNMG
jgi:hypothetical protein